MLTLEEQVVTENPTIKVIKRDGRLVRFDADKIYKALLKASNQVVEMSPLVEAKLEEIAERVVREIYSRFSQDVKIYEIQNIVEHELLAANEYVIAQ